MQNKLKLSSSRGVRVRGQIDIMASILNEAVEGARKTRIMYRCNLSHRQLQAYLKLLSGTRLLTLVTKSGSNNPNFFKTSTKGHDFLEAYRKLKALMT